jgi:hypothetical protein
LRYATVLATVPGHTAMVFVAFAGIAGMPVNSSAGNDTKLPPPATEFSSPATSAAQNKNIG